MSYPKQKYHTIEQPLDALIRSPLLQAIDQNNLQLCEELISNDKSQVQEVGWNNLTPLHQVCLRGQIEILHLLLRYGGELNARSTFGETPLHYACRRGDVAIIHVLIKCGADIFASDNHGKSCIHFTSLGGSIPAMHYLETQTQLQLNAKDKNGDTALHIACNHRHFSLVNYLLRKNRSDPSQQNNKGLTALHIASQLGIIEVVWKLLNAGNCGLISIRDEHGNTSLDLVKKELTSRSQEVKETLQYFIKEPPNAPPAGPYKLWWFLLLFPFCWATFAFLVYSYFNGYSGFFALAMFAFLIWFVYRQWHRLHHPKKWPNPIFLGAFAGGILHCLIIGYSRVIPDMWPCYYLAACITFLSTACVYYFYQLVRGDPGFVVKSRYIDGKPASIIDIAEGKLKESDFCPFTELIRPERTKYCKLCEKLVVGLDHHCLFIGNCVARYNHRDFVVFILIVMSLQILFVISTWLYISTFYSTDLSQLFSMLFHYEPRFLDLALLCTLSLLWESALIAEQLKNILRGQTTYYSGPRPSLSIREALQNLYLFLCVPKRRSLEKNAVSMQI